MEEMDDCCEGEVVGTMVADEAIMCNSKYLSHDDDGVRTRL
jgi:hypothetical protein